jgi:hypothetical protein
MTTYDVYRHPTLGYAAVKRGFSWPGFFVWPVWALSKRMWLGGGLLLAAAIFLLGAQSDANAKGDSGGAFVLFLIGLTFALTVGFLANKRWRHSLARRGFEHLGTADAEEPDGAIASFVNNASLNSASIPTRISA